MLKYSLGIAQKVTMVILGIWVICFFISKSQEANFTPKESHWSNLDPNKEPSEVLRYNYKQGNVEYRQYGPAPKSTYKPVKGNVKDPENLIYDSNIEIEELIDYAYSY